MLSFLLLFAFLHIAFPYTFRDNPIISLSEPIYLDGYWSINSTGYSFPQGGSVPGDLLSDLQQNNVIGDPLYELNAGPENATTLPVWADREWTYSTPLLYPAGDYVLVFDGVKMGATISLVGENSYVTLDTVNNQFIRYQYPITLSANNPVNLTVTFHLATDPPNDDARFMACSGGWDWAPYTNQLTNSGFRVLSKGIYKSVYLIPNITESTVLIESVVPQLFYLGKFPTKPLTPEDTGDFNASFMIYVNSYSELNNQNLTVSFCGSKETVPVNIPAGNSTIVYNKLCRSGSFQLWWPVDLGVQILEKYSIQFEGLTDAWVDSTGFRVAHLITVNDTSPYAPYAANLDSSGTLTMKLRINGAEVWSRGANFIPLHLMEGRHSIDDFPVVLAAALQSGMNTLRVWGGGIWQYEAFYELADEWGIILYHDAMYGGSGSPVSSGSLSEKLEIEYQVRRLAKHPSIIIWDSCNECNAGGYYDTFVMPTIVASDSSRPVWPSSPSFGWWSGVNGLTGLPNGSPFFSRQASSSAALPPLAPTNNGDQCFYVDSTAYQPPATANPIFIQQDSTAEECCSLVQNASLKAYGATFFSFNSSCLLYAGAPTQQADSMFAFNGAVALFPGTNPPPPVPPVTFETHGYYQHGQGFPSVNGQPGAPFAFLTGLPLEFEQPSYSRGGGFNGVFASEFGASVWPGFESLSATIGSDKWALHGAQPADNCIGDGWPSVCLGNNVMAQRNYPADNFLLTYFGNYTISEQRMNVSSEATLRQQLYLDMLAQALYIRNDIEGRRSTNEVGTLVWQLNDIWPTGSWGSLEYVNTGEGGNLGPRRNQLTFNQTGRWRPLNHFYREYLFNDVIVSCSGYGLCYARNDVPVSYNISVTLSIWDVQSGNSSVFNTLDLRMSPGVAKIVWFCSTTGVITDGNFSCPQTIEETMATYNLNVNTSLLKVDVNTLNDLSYDPITSYNLMTIPGNLAIGEPTISYTIREAKGGAVVTVSSSGNAALYVYLTTSSLGIFDYNVQMIPANSKFEFRFLQYTDQFDIELFSETLFVYDLYHALNIE